MPSAIRDFRYTIATVLVVWLGLVPASPARGDEPREHADPHAHHAHMLQQPGYERSVQTYLVPEVGLVDTNGQKVSLQVELGGDEPVMLDFIFTTCTTICPVLSATFMQVQRMLGADADKVRMFSVSIDPDHDTPARLKEYAGTFHAGPSWQFLTGDLRDVVALQKAFDAYRGDKMNHPPIIFLRAKADQPWVRIDGFASGADLVREYQMLVSH